MANETKEVLASPTRRGVVDTGSQGTEVFPIEAFKFDPPSEGTPDISLQNPWRLNATNSFADTAANLASANPVLPKGWIAYETDTLSLKIGDGTTAYNSLTYFYRGLPVAGEESLGTPHFRARQSTAALLSQVQVAGTWYTVTFSGYPTGTKALTVYCQLSASGTGGLFWRPYNNGDTVAQSFTRGITANTNGYSGAQALVVPDSSGRVDFGANVAGGSFQVNDWLAYWM